MTEHDEENEVEVEGEHYLKVPMAHYNSLVDAADLGFEVLVERRNALRDMGKRVPQYPDRDSAKMTTATDGVLNGIPLRHHDILDLERSYTSRIKCLAEALNHRLTNKRYR